jgi:hypothetical protein
MIDDKLKATLYDKKKYRVHIFYLQVGLGLGYKVTKVHRAIKFKQEPIMRDYITMLALERKKHPKGTFLNDLYKLMANSLFGKTIENPENYRDHKVAIGDEDVVKLLNNRRLKHFHILDDDCETVLAELQMNKVKYNKPIAIGCSILDISKAYMASFYYGCLKPYYMNNMQFMYTDTDSIVAWLKTIDLKKDIKTMNETYDKWFETEEDAGLPGKMKIEKDNIKEFRAYCPKHYYYIQLKDNKYVVSEAFKGVPKKVRKGKELSQEEIVEHLNKNQPLASVIKFDFKAIRSKKHEIHVVNVTKEISDKDDKRLYLDDYHTVALGYTT